MYVSMDILLYTLFLTSFTYLFSPIDYIFFLRKGLCCIYSVHSSLTALQYGVSTKSWLG